MNSQDLFADGSTSKTTTGFATGSTCSRTGSYKASNKYMEAIVVVKKGDRFPTFTDGKKTTWYALSSSSTSSTSSGFDSVKVEAGTV